VNYPVRITAKAGRDVDEILNWLTQQGADAAAQRWFDRLWASLATLEKFPHRCPLAAEAGDLELPIRETLFGRRHGRYRILFQIVARKVYILHIRHAAQDAFSPGDLR
jgi:plasmid stabilization system protein ParE